MSTEWTKKIKDHEHGDIRRFITETKKTFLKNNKHNVLKYYKEYDPLSYAKLIKTTYRLNQNYLKKKKENKNG